MNFFAAIKIALQLLAIIPDVILTIQKIFPNTAGSDKLNIAKTMLQSTSAVAPEIATEFDTVWKIAEPVIAAVVTAYKADGTIAPKS